jgi:hypothetical protein
VRRKLLIGVFALIVALSAVAAGGSATRSSPRQMSCGQTLVIVLFWPHGHGAIRSVGFTADPRPHVEIYKYGTKGYPKRNFVAYGNAGGKTRFAKTCYTTPSAPPGHTIPQQATVRKARALSCRLPSKALIRTRSVAGRFQIDVGTPGARVFSAKLRRRGSWLDYSGISCNVGPAPH